MVILSFIGIINLHSALIKVRFTTQIGVRMTGDYIKDIWITIRNVTTASDSVQ